MKREGGLGIVLMIILICFVCAVAGGLIYWYIQLKSDVRDSSVKSNMLLIQGACKVSYEANVMNKTTDKLIGTKLSEVDDNGEIDKDIINTFKQTNVVEESEYDKYYVLTNDNLKELKLEVTNEEGAYYIIGYEKEDVIITKGYDGKYRLSDINKEETKDEQEETSEEDDDESKEENNTEERLKQ